MQRGIPRAADTDHELVLVHAVPVLVPLQLLRVFPDKTKHVVGGHPTLLDVLARGIEPSVGCLSQTWLKREQIIPHDPCFACYRYRR